MKVEYVDMTPAEFDTELARRTEALESLFAEGSRLQQEIANQLGRLRFE